MRFTVLLELSAVHKPGLVEILTVLLSRLLVTYASARIGPPLKSIEKAVSPPLPTAAGVNHQKSSYTHQKVMSSYTADNMNCIIIQAMPRILLRYKSVNIPPSSRIPAVDSFFNWLSWQLVCIVETL